MPEETPDELEVDFISAPDDAQLRLGCFQSIAFLGLPFSDSLKTAKALYDWIMDTGDEDAAADAATSEDSCGRRH